MNRFKKPLSKPLLSIDGFVPNSSPLLGRRRAVAEPVQASSRLEQPGLDDFSLPNGFSSSETAELPMPSEADGSTEISFNSAEKPKLAAMAKDSDDKSANSAKKRRFFRRRKNSDDASLKAGKKPKNKKLKLALKGSAIVGIMAVLLTGFIFGKLYLKAHKIFHGDGGNGAAALNKNVDPIQLKGEGDGRINILILGKGGPGHDGPDLTDTILIASIDPVDNSAALLSVPRDLYVKAPSGGSSKINAIYANAKYAILNRNGNATSAINAQAEKAGIDAIDSTVSQTMGIPIHYYVMLDFEAFREAIDTVGGLDINVTEQLYDPNVAWENNNNPLIAKVGLDHMNGKLALLYARSREGSVRGDFDRTERQRAILLALKSKILSIGTFANPLKVSQLIDAFGNHISTNLRLDEVSRLYDIGKKIDSAKVGSIGLADPPNNYVVTDNLNGLSIVEPRAGLYNYSEIQNYIRSVALRDSFLKNENASLEVLNGTATVGLATKKADQLKSYGYNVTKVDSAPTTNYPKTILVDLTKGAKKYTLNYLQKRLGVKAVSTLPDSTISSTGADFVIILGSNETTGQ